MKIISFTILYILLCQSFKISTCSSGDRNKNYIQLLNKCLSKCEDPQEVKVVVCMHYIIVRYQEKINLNNYH